MKLHETSGSKNDVTNSVESCLYEPKRKPNKSLSNLEGFYEQNREANDCLFGFSL